MRIAFVMDDLSVHSNGTSVTAALRPGLGAPLAV